MNTNNIQINKKSFFQRFFSFVKKATFGPAVNDQGRNIKEEQAHPSGFYRYGYQRHLSAAHFYLWGGLVFLIVFFLVFPQTFFFTVAILTQSDAAGVIAKLIFFFLLMGLHISMLSLKKIKYEYLVMKNLVEGIQDYNNTERNIRPFIDTFVEGVPLRSQGIVHHKLKAATLYGTREAMSSQLDIHMTLVHSRIRFVEYLINAMPMLGLVGTLIGLSIAVAGMQGIVEIIGRTTQIGSQLNVALEGMGGAFFTTLFGVGGMLILRFVNVTIENTTRTMLYVMDDVFLNIVGPFLRRGAIIERKRRVE